MEIPISLWRVHKGTIWQSKELQNVSYMYILWKLVYILPHVLIPLWHVLCCRYKNWLELDKPILDPSQDLPKVTAQPVTIFFAFK